MLFVKHSITINIYNNYIKINIEQNI